MEVRMFGRYGWRILAGLVLLVVLAGAVGLLGCFAPLLFFFLVFALFRLIFWGGIGGHHHWGMGHHGPGGFPGFAPDDVRNRWSEKAEEWHRQMHEQGGSDVTPEDRA